MRFPKSGVLFAVDIILIKTVAFRTFPDAYMPDWIRSIRRVERLKFDILAPGHGRLGTKADATAFREFLQDLYKAVLAGTRSGKTVAQLQQEFKLPKYSKWAMHGRWLKENIAGMYRMVQANRRGN